MPEKIGYGIIRLSFSLGEHVMPQVQMDGTTTQGFLRGHGYFSQVHERLLLPASYEILAIYIEYQKLCWVLVVQSPEIPLVDEGAELPHCTPVYTHTYNYDGTYTGALKRIDIEPHDRVLRVD